MPWGEVDLIMEVAVIRKQNCQSDRRVSNEPLQVRGNEHLEAVDENDVCAITGHYPGEKRERTHILPRLCIKEFKIEI